MAERPIIFSGPMVRAILEGRKTQTRRAIKPHGRFSLFDGTWTDDYVLDPGNASWRAQAVRYEPGDLLWVRERCWLPEPEICPASGAEMRHVTYHADHGDDRVLRWTPSIHMPRWASRITLEITDVRVQRLLNISEEDAQAESFAAGPFGDPIPETDIGGGYTISSPGGWASAAGHFQAYWAELHPEWDGYSSPWVVALTFKIVSPAVSPTRKPSETLGGGAQGRSATSADTCGFPRK